MPFHGRRTVLKSSLVDRPDLRSIQRMVSRLVERDGCWVWTGTRSGEYGQIRLRENVRESEQWKTRWVHRVAYATWFGMVPSDSDVHHVCTNTICCNPAHLELLSRSENVREAVLRNNGKVPF